ncbi:hypothetical protein ACIQOV_28400 [Kitasatospora sp. NPDC091257]
MGGGEVAVGRRAGDVRGRAGQQGVGDNATVLGKVVAVLRSP